MFKLIIVLISLFYLNSEIKVLRAEKYGCDFETTCSNLVLDQFWSLAAANSPFASDAPNHDHTYDNSSGHYIYFNSNGGPLFTDSILKFDTIFNLTNSNESDSRCLQFYYIIDADQSKNLTVRLAMGDNGDLQPIWLTVNTLSNKSNDWTLGEIRLPNDAFYIWLVFAFSDTPRPSRVLLVLDDIFVTDECQSSSYENDYDETETVLYWCDFERDTCAYENTMNLNWSRVEANEKPTTYGPFTDHTLGTDSGHYLISQLPTEKRTAQVERVVSERLTVPNDGTPYCVSFYYYLDAADTKINLLTIPLVDSSSDVTYKRNNKIWPTSSGNGLISTQKWTWAIANLIPGSFKFSFVIFNQQTSDLKASIDDIKIHACPAVNNPLTAYDPSDSYFFELQCDFETDRCGFSDNRERNDDDNSSDLLRATDPSYWSRIDAHQNLYPSLGPPNDHTTGTADGHYLTVNFTAPVSFDFFASTSTSPLFSHSDLCVEFYYYANSEAFSDSSKSSFAAGAGGGCYADTLFYSHPFQSNNTTPTTPEWTRVVARASEYACRELFYFDFKLEDLLKLSVSIDDVRVDLCTRIGPTPITSTTASTTTSTTTASNSTTTTTSANSTTTTANSTSTTASTTTTTSANSTTTTATETNSTTASTTTSTSKSSSPTTSKTETTRNASISSTKSSSTIFTIMINLVWLKKIF